MSRQSQCDNGNWSGHCKVVSLQQAFIQEVADLVMQCSLSKEGSSSSWTTSTMLNALCRGPPRTATGKAYRLSQRTSKNGSCWPCTLYF